MTPATATIKHVVVIIGMIIAVFGAIYNASGFLDKEGRFFKNVTQTFIFGIGGGIIIGIGFGAFGPLFTIANTLPDTYTHMQSLNDNPLSLISAFFSIGLAFGMILGLFTGWGYTKIQTPNVFPKTKREGRWAFISAFCTLLVISVCIQSIAFPYLTIPSMHLLSPPQLEGIVVLNIPLFLGCTTSFIFCQRDIHNLFESENDRQKYIFQLLFLFINIFLLSLFIVIAIYYLSSLYSNNTTYYLLHTSNYSQFIVWGLPRIISSAREFIFGFLIMNELNRQRKHETLQDKPSWIKFIFYSILLIICGYAVNHTIYYYCFPQYKTDPGVQALPQHIMKLTVLIGLLLGIRKGHIDTFIKQPSRTAFTRGFVGFIVFGIYTLSLLFANPFLSFTAFNTKFLVTICSLLTNSIPIGLLIGCVYGFRPFFSYIQNLSVERLGEIFGKIGVILTVISIILLGLQEFIP